MRIEPVLVAYGSKRGGTAEIARWIGDALGTSGIQVEVRPAKDVPTLDGYGAVILGGALYFPRWHRDARRFARHFSRQLRERSVWLFCSGPLDHTAEEPNSDKISGVSSVKKFADRLNARGVAVFGGKLDRDARGFPAAAMAKNNAGDFRNKDRIRAWATDIATDLAALRSTQS